MLTNSVHIFRIHNTGRIFTYFEFTDLRKLIDKWAFQAPSVETKATWVYEIKRCLLEHLPNISPENREVLLNGIPSMDKTNQFNDILSNSKYKSKVINNIQ